MTVLDGLARAVLSGVSMRLVAIALSVALSVALALATLPASAKGPARPSRLEEGRRAFAAGNYASAREALGAAYARSHDAATLWLIAMTDLRLEDWPAAATNLVRYSAARDATREGKAAASKRLIDVRKKVVELEVDLPEGSAFTIDEGTGLVVTPGSRIYVTPGKHRLHVLSGARDVLVDIDAAAADRITVRLPAEIPPNEPSTPVLLATKAPEVFMQPSPSEAPVPVADARPVAPHAAGAPRAKTVAVLSLAGVALGAGAVGAYFLASSEGARSDAVRLREESHALGTTCSGTNAPRCIRATTLDDQASTQRSVAIGLFTGAAAFGASALVTHLVWPESKVQIGGRVSSRDLVVGATVPF